MIQTLEALFDGSTLHPEVPLNLKAGTRVRIIVESVLPDTEKSHKTFLEIARSLHLQGESDWSVNIDRYLYGDIPSDNN